MTSSCAFILFEDEPCGGVDRIDVGRTPVRTVREWIDTGWPGASQGSRDSECWFLAELQRVAIRIIDVENNFAKDEALSRFMFIWRREQSWLSLVSLVEDAPW
jgi:hypothetical protein